jgi:hypothetical protein
VGQIRNWRPLAAYTETEGKERNIQVLEEHKLSNVCLRPYTKYEAYLTDRNFVQTT